MNKLIVFIICILSVNCIDFYARESVYSITGIFYPKVSSRSVILGKIININEIPDAPRKIELTVDDITINYQHSFETGISDSGDFKFDIPLYHSINTYLNYGDARITPYLFTNDTIHIDCKIGKRGFQIGIVSGKFDNKHEKFENDFFINSRWIHTNQLNEFSDRLLKDQTPQQLKEQYLNFEKELAERIKERVEKDSLDSRIADYLKYTATYSIYRDIIKIGKKVENKDDKRKFYEFLKDTVVFNEKALVTSAYRLFLSSYKDKVELRPDSTFVSSGNTREESTFNLLGKVLEFDFKNRVGLWAEFMAAEDIFIFLLSENEPTQEIKKASDLIQKTFTDKYILEILHSLLEKSCEKKPEIILQPIPVDAYLRKYDSLSGEQLYNKILEENKGKVIYIDIWATWCSPCKEQIPHSQRLHKMLKGKNVSFVYLCCQSEEKIWQNNIKQFQMTGNQILLNDKQFKYLQSKFSIDGIPRYILIDSSGKVIDDDAPRPNSEIIITKINELIK